MEKRKLGHSGIEVPTLCFGGNVFGWTIDEKKSFEILDAALDAGLNFIDTADAYSRWAPGNKGGESEAILGKWFKARGNRDRVVLATKVGSDMGQGKKSLAGDYIRRAVDGSLRRLQTDYIDLYQSHWDDPDTPQEETLRAYADLVSSGKVRAIGASNFSAERLRSALELSRKNNLPSYQTLQPEYNLYDRSGYESSLEQVGTENGLGVIPYFSLAAGFLTGKYRSAADAEGKARGGMLKKYLNDRGFRIVQALNDVANENGATPAQVALAWLIARPSITAPIASATSVEQLHDIAKATSLKLSKDAVEKLNEASAETVAA